VRNIDAQIADIAARNVAALGIPILLLPALCLVAQLIHGSLMSGNKAIAILATEYSKRIFSKFKIRPSE